MPARIGRPCGQTWSSMRPVQGGRHCDACERTVVDLVGMTEARAMALAIFAGPRGMCGRALTDERGEIFFKKTPRRDRRLVVLAASALTVSACGGSAPSPPSSSPRGLDVAAPVPAAATCDPDEKILALAQPADVTLASSPTDRDGDGVADDDDKCPEEAGRDLDGCAAPRRVVVTSAGDLAIMPLLHFAWGGAVLGPEAASFLDAVADVMTHQPQVTKVEVQGHTDATEGGAAALSKRRAQVVVDGLVQRGIDAKRLAAVGYAATRPIEPGGGAEARQHNRRVELRVVP